MNSAIENDILFDDQLTLLQVNGNSNPALSSNHDCDCSSYKPETIQKERDTDQITPFIGQAN